MRGCLLLVGFLGATACAGGSADTTINVTFDPCETLVLAPASDASVAERAGIAAAIELWNAATPTQLTLSDSAGAAHLPIRFEDAALAFHGVYEDEKGIVFVNRGLTVPSERAITIAHEIGHAMGLQHVTDRPSLMNPGNLTVLPQESDVAALAAMWGVCPRQ